MDFPLAEMGHPQKRMFGDRGDEDSVWHMFGDRGNEDSVWHMCTSHPGRHITWQLGRQAELLG